MNDLNLDTPHVSRPGTAPDAPSHTGAGQDHGGVKLNIEDMQVSMAIGEEDEVQGKITITGAGKTLVIRGTVDGEIVAAGNVIVMNSARVFGKITAASLTTEGEIGDVKRPAEINVGALTFAANSRTVANCTYDTMCVETPNRGIRGTLQPREEQGTVDA